MMDSSIRNQLTADGTSVSLENLVREKSLETTAESVSSTNKTVRVNVFPPHLRDTSYDIWLHSSYAITNEEKLKQSFESQICNSPCRFNGDKEEVASTVTGELSQQMSSQARKMVEFLEKAESDIQQRLEVTSAEQQTTKIRLQNALTELEIARAEMVKVQRESVRKLALERKEEFLLRCKHAEEISSLEEKNSATVHALEQTQIEAGQLKSSLESSLIQLAKTEGHLKEALDRENSLKEELKKLQNERAGTNVEEDTSSSISESFAVENEKKPLTSEEWKAKGNHAFKAGKYSDAIDYYTKAIETGGADSSELATYYQNRAAAFEQLKDYPKVAENCSQAISLNEKYVKAYLRRGKAYEHLYKLEEALEDVTTTCLLEGFQNQSTIGIADRVLKNLGQKNAKEEMANRRPNLPSPHYIKSFFASFSQDPIQEAVNLALDKGDGRRPEDTPLLCFHKREYDEVIPACSDVLEVYENEVIRLLRGTSRMLSLDFAGALEDFDKLISFGGNPKVKVNAMIKRALLQMTLKSPLDSLKDFCLAICIDGNNADIYHHRGQINLLIERMEEARSDFTKAVDLSSNYPIAYVQKLHADYEYYAFVKGDTCKADETLDHFKEAMEKYPNCVECYSLYAQVLTDTSKFDEAEKLFKKAMQIDPENANLLVRLAMLSLQTRGDIKEATRLLEEAVTKDPKCDFALVTIGTIEVQKGRLDKSVDYFRRAIPLARSEAELSHLFSLINAAIAQTKVANKFGLRVPSWTSWLGFGLGIGLDFL